MRQRLKLFALWVLCCVAVGVLIIAMLFHTLLGSQRRAMKVAIGIDQAANALLGGSEDETISSRVGRHAADGKHWALALERFIDALFGAGHCRAAKGT